MRSSTRVLLSLVKQNKKVYIADAIAMFIANASIALMPIFFGLAVGTAVDSSQYERAGLFLFLGFFMNVIHWASWHVGDYIVMKHVLKDMYKLRDVSYKRVWDKPYAEFIEKPSSKIAYAVGRLHEEGYYLYHAIHFGMFSNIVYYIVLVLSITALSWQNGAVYIVFIFVALSVMYRKVKKLAAAQKVTADQTAEKNGKIYDDVSNFINVFSFNTKSREKKKTSQLNNDLYKTHRKSEFRNMEYWVSASTLARIILWAVVLSLNFYLLQNGIINQATFAAAVSVLVTFTADYWEVAHQIGQFGNRYAAFSQHYTYLFKEEDILTNSLTKNLLTDRTLTENLTFSNVDFAYPDAPDIPALHDVTFTVNKGEKIGIVGKSGGGKSTLVKLLLGFYEPTSGEIAIDSQSVPTEELNTVISYVPQDTTLFQESIGYNIGYAVKEKVTDEDVVAAAKKAHAHDFISKMTKGYETLVGERGVKLSLGQRQRVALARAFLKDSELLVLDEATSSLDSKTEKDIQKSLEKLWENKTVIAIAHRLSTLNNVDRILVVDNGKIVESGTKDELLQNDGKFADLWNHQKNGLI